MTEGRKNLHRKRSRFMKHDILKRRMVPLKKGWIYKSGGEIKTWKRRFLILTESRSVAVRLILDRLPLTAIARHVPCCSQHDAVWRTLLGALS